MEMDPFADAGTIAALETTPPLNAFKVETRGWGLSDGNMLRYPRNAGATTVTFIEYALALAGMLHRPWGMGNDRVSPAAMVGGPKTPVGCEPGWPARVSTTRHGATAIKRSPPGVVPPEPVVNDQVGEVCR